ncbi:MAG: cation-translocating P-type ATPase [Anaerolineae bacterium]|jgi:Ca2+-transporting ATPase|nr:cation-translocating P-type ATPase [Anaerolineae bacterium]
MKPKWYQFDREETLSMLKSGLQGLSNTEIQQRREKYGENVLEEKAARSPWRMLLAQFTETMVLILLAAALVSGLLGKTTETIAILAIVVLFAVLGFIQEYRAEKAMAALKQLAVPIVRVRREDKIIEIPASSLVPGDIVLLEAGNAVPADLRIIESLNLRIQEAALTGESEPVEKKEKPILADDLPLGDRRNMAYFGTVVTYGRGTGVVVETGMNTELGKIAALIQNVADSQTPLQKRLDQIGKSLALGGVIAAILVLIIGVLRGEPVADMFLTAVSVAVAVVPEGLPAVVTITLALGAQRMLKRNALIRKLPAVETLGSVTVICSDKTGTLTENKMTVTVVDVAGETLDLVEELNHRQPSIILDDSQNIQDEISSPIQLTLIGGTLCNDAVLVNNADDQGFHALGDPTEGAFVIAAKQIGFQKKNLETQLPREVEFPFDSERKRMTTVHAVKDQAELPQALLEISDTPYLAFTKGSVDGLLTITSKVWINGQMEPLTEAWRERIQSANDNLAKAGVRVLGVTFRQLDHIPEDLQNELEQELVFIGLVGMMDPPRTEVAAAVKTSLAAGIRPIMITGDHPLTAITIAKDLGITQNDAAITGQALNQMTEDELSEKVLTTSVFARVSPEDKLRIVQALQKHGHVVAMTGDGVNDSPALKKADIGVAMGITGTDVAKEASEMVLLDDNFATIVAAVKEGRVIYDNLLRFIKFSLGGNLGKVLVMLGAPLLGINVALSPLQLLWLNLLTDGLMGLGLGVEPAEDGTMKRAPRSTTGPVLDKPARIHVSWVGIVIAAITLTLGGIYYEPGSAIWQTMIFAALGFTQIGHAIGLRASGQSPLNLKSNPLMTWLTLVTLILQLAVIYIPFLDRFFGLVPLPIGDLLIAAALGSITFIGVRIEKRLTD